MSYWYDFSLSHKSCILLECWKHWIWADNLCICLYSVISHLVCSKQSSILLKYLCSMSSISSSLSFFPYYLCYSLWNWSAWFLVCCSFYIEILDCFLFLLNSETLHFLLLPFFFSLSLSLSLSLSFLNCFLDLSYLVDKKKFILYNLHNTDKGERFPTHPLKN